MEGHLYQINRLIDDKDQLVAEKNENMQSHHQMWRELATAIKQKDAHINDLISELWKRSTESIDTIKRHGEQMGVLREDYDRRTDLLELKLQRLEAAHAENMTDLRSENRQKSAHLRHKLDDLRRKYKAEKRALVEKNRDLQKQLEDAHRQLEEQDEAYFNADDSVPNELLEPSTAPISNPEPRPAEHNTVTADQPQPHNAENINTAIAMHSDSDMDETADVSSSGTLSDADSSDDE